MGGGGGLRGVLTHRLGRFDENLGPSQLELVLVHVDGAQQVEDALFFVPSPGGPGLPSQDGVPGERAEVRFWFGGVDFSDDLTRGNGSDAGAYLLRNFLKTLR